MPDIVSITEIAPWLLYAAPIAVVIGALCANTSATGMTPPKTA